MTHKTTQFYKGSHMTTPELNLEGDNVRQGEHQLDELQIALMRPTVDGMLTPSEIQMSGLLIHLCGMSEPPTVPLGASGGADAPVTHNYQLI